MKLIPKHQNGRVIVEGLNYPTWPSYSPYAYKRILDLNEKPIQIFGDYPDALTKADRDHWAQVAYDLYPEGGLVDIDKVNEEVDKRKRNYASYVALKQKEWSYPSSTISYEPDWRKRARNRILADRQRDNLIVYDDYTKQFRDVDGYDVANGIGDILLSPLGMVPPQEGRNYEDIENLKILTPLGLIALNLTDDPRKVSAVSILSGIPTYASVPYYGAVVPTIAMMPSTFYGMFKSFKDATKEEGIKGLSKSASGKSIKSFTFKRPKNEKSN